MSSLPNLVELIKQAAVEAVETAKPTAVVFGTVISEVPLKINVEQKLTLTEEFLILSRNVTDHQTWMSFDNPSLKQKIAIWNRPRTEPVTSPEPPPFEVSESTDIQFLPTNYKTGENIDNKDAGIQPSKHVITVYNGLKIGEKVLLARQQGGQKYIVIDRVMGL